MGGSDEVQVMPGAFNLSSLVAPASKHLCTVTVKSKSSRETSYNSLEPAFNIAGFEYGVTYLSHAQTR